MRADGAASETPAVVKLFGADQWLVADGATGPFTTTHVLASTTQDAVQSLPGVQQADAVVVSRTVIVADPPKDANLIGHAVGGLGSPPINAGRAVESSGEAVVTDTVDTKVGDPLAVVGGSDVSRPWATTL